MQSLTYVEQTGGEWGVDVGAVACDPLAIPLEITRGVVYRVDWIDGAREHTQVAEGVVEIAFVNKLRSLATSVVDRERLIGDVERAGVKRFCSLEGGPKRCGEIDGARPFAKTVIHKIVDNNRRGYSAIGVWSENAAACLALGGSVGVEGVARILTPREVSEHHVFVGTEDLCCILIPRIGVGIEIVATKYHADGLVVVGIIIAEREQGTGL